ncbi:YhgE/Pip domain-containing protein [Terrilactibacillus laevilacticus]|uniref:YhgE/Pip family protein n=1 Tax=Terrilactibacillus laevilacticus TaxID=1380157 RepID=A0ABW5PSF8_9BACI|nr:YhgE/Pip domain-containing protein [Terrilactibacillus laevilacticus]
MSKILHIYQLDWIKMCRTPSILVLVLGLIFLPSAYAWINIKALWDPYSHTSGIKVAVINEDQGAKIQGKTIHVGDEIIDKLKHNHNLGWEFVDRETGEDGLKEGSYYASILIPKNFSTDISSILKDHPKKPELKFSVNEKINSVAPKVATSGATTITTEIRQAFIKTVGKALFTEFNKVGLELKQDMPLFLHTKNQINQLEDALPQIRKMGQEAILLEKKLPEIKAKGQKVILLENRLSDIDRAGDTILKVEDKLPLINEAGDQIMAIQNKVDRMDRAAGLVNHQVSSNLSEISEALNDEIRRLQQITASNQEITGNQQELESQYTELQDIRNEIQAVSQGLDQRLTKAASMLQSTSQFMSQDLPTVEQKIHRAANFVRNDLPKLEQDVRRASDLVRTKLPQVEQVIKRAANFARNDLPTFEKDVHTASNKINQFSNNMNLNDAINMLMHDPQSHSEFLSNPITLKTERVFPIPNYGSAMSPFYTVLAFWVGATLLISSLPTRVEDQKHLYTPRQKYLGRLLSFLSMGLAQAAVVSLGDIYLIKTYIVNKGLFFLLCLLSSLVFITITYTLCSLFGNIGKGLSVIILVLQISASSGTFPVSMTPSFFQTLSPFLPFTYAISMVRESVGGVVAHIVVQDVLILLLYLIISLGIALIYNGFRGRFMERSKPM